MTPVRAPQRAEPERPSTSPLPDRPTILRSPQFAKRVTIGGLADAPPHPSIFLQLHALDALAGALLRKTAPTLISSDYAAMSAIIRIGDATPSNVAALLGVPLTTASDRLNRLVARGYARRIPNPRDGRSALFELTEEGWTEARAIAVPFTRLVDRIRDRLPLPEDEVGDVLAALDGAFRAELQELDPEHSPPP